MNMSKTAIVVEHGTAEALNAMGVDIRFLCSAKKTGKAFSVMEMSVPAGFGPPPHEHPWAEAYYMLEGEMRFSLGEREVLARKGDFLYAAGGVVHGFQGASESPARALVFDAPAASEDFFRELNREVKRMPDDLPKALEIGRKHQIHFVHA